MRPCLDKQYLETAAEKMAEIAEVSSLSEDAMRRRREYDSNRRMRAEEEERY